MILFRVLILIGLFFLWRCTYPKVALWINSHTRIGLKDNVDAINAEDKLKHDSEVKSSEDLKGGGSVAK